MDIKCNDTIEYYNPISNLKHEGKVKCIVTVNDSVFDREIGLKLYFVSYDPTMQCDIVKESQIRMVIANGTN